jgi:hypothetical protein
MAQWLLPSQSSRLLARVCDHPCLLAEYHLFSMKLVIDIN